MYFAVKKLPEDKCLLLPEGFSKEIAHSPSEDIRKYKWTLESTSVDR